MRQPHKNYNTMTLIYLILRTDILYLTYNMCFLTELHMYLPGLNYQRQTFQAYISMFLQFIVHSRQKTTDIVIHIFADHAQI